MSKFNADFAATVLLEAAFTTDKAVCVKYGITDRTLRNYRQRLAADANFSAIFHTKKESVDKAWADELGTALRKGIRLIAECADGFGQDEQMYKRNPELIAAIAGAVKICAEVYYTGKVIDARLAGQDRSAGQVPDEDAADSESQYAN